MNVPSKYPEDVEAGRRVGRHVEAYMKRHHLGVNEMAQLLQVNHGTVSRMLSGECGVEIVPSHQSARFASERQEKRGLR